MIDVGGFCEDIVRCACAPVCELLPIRPQEDLGNEGEGDSGRKEEGGVVEIGMWRGGKRKEEWWEEE